MGLNCSVCNMWISECRSKGTICILYTPPWCVPPSSSPVLHTFVPTEHSSIKCQVPPRPLSPLHVQFSIIRQKMISDTLGQKIVDWDSTCSKTWYKYVKYNASVDLPPLQNLYNHIPRILFTGPILQHERLLCKKCKDITQACSH